MTLDLKAIRERAEKATAGPWKVKDSGWPNKPVVVSEGTATLGEGLLHLGILRREDAEFIAHACEDIPALLAEVERLEVYQMTRKMRPVLQQRTVLAALARLNKRLDKLRAEADRITAEMVMLSDLRQALERQLPAPLPGPMAPGNAQGGPALDPGTVSEPEPVPTVLGSGESKSNPGELKDVDGCLWVTGNHQHREDGNQEVCLAPEEQWRKP